MARATSARLRPTPSGATAAIAATVVALDGASKQLALTLLGDGVVPLGAGTFLGVVFNPTFALGYSLGGHSLLAAALVSLAVVGLIALVCRPLTSAAPQAPWTLGLIAGAALANPGSLLLGTPGVVDFIGVPYAGGALVFNLADVAAYLGVALSVPLAGALVAQAWRERSHPTAVRPQPVAVTTMATAAALTPRRRSPVEIEVPVPMFADDQSVGHPGMVDGPADRVSRRELWMELPAAVAPRADDRVLPARER
jgi:lipoprotein signal peptidase